jgi:FdhD protein
MTDRVAITAVIRMGSGPPRTDQDLVAAEAPLSVDVRHPASPELIRLGLLMRTPGDDGDLVRGLLLSEGLIRTATDIESVTIDAGPDGSTVAIVTLAADVPRPAGAERGEAAATSACGLCGRLALRAVEHGGRPPDVPRFEAAAIARIPAALRNGQTVFAETGGLHAAARVGADGHPGIVREDVGRHNAVDKVIGWSLLRGEVPLTDRILAVSGRAGFEIVQKAIRAAIPVLVAVGAASSSAVDLAHASGMALHTFVAPGRGNSHV